MSSMIGVVVLRMVPIFEVVFMNEFFYYNLPCFLFLEVYYSNSNTLVQELFVELLYLASLRNLQ